MQNSVLNIMGKRKNGIMTIQEQWKDICNEYLKRFCVKHGYYLDKYPWVGDDPGTTASICDLFVDMETIRYDIDNNIDEEKFEKWYWKNLDVYELTGCNYMNFSSYCKGAPDLWPEDKLERIREAQKRVIEAQKFLEDEIENAKNTRNFKEY